MNSLLVDRIKKDFPHIVWDSVAAHWGIECGTGWGLLVYLFVLDATALCEKSGGKLVISQIKNKFGTLHLYCHQSGGADEDENGRADFVPKQYGRIFSFRPYPANPTFRTLVTYYEQASAHVCELCGKPAHIDPDVSSWLTPLCHPHAALIHASGYRDAPEQFDEIDRDAATSILARIDKLTNETKDE